MKINLAGRDLTEYLIRLMTEVNRSFSNIAETERDNARDTKEKKVSFPILILSIVLHSE